MKTVNALLAIGYALDMFMGLTAASPVDTDAVVTSVVPAIKTVAVAVPVIPAVKTIAVTVPVPATPTTSKAPLCGEPENGIVTCITSVPIRPTSVVTVFSPAPSPTTSVPIRPTSTVTVSIADFYADAGASWEGSKTCVLWGPESCLCGTEGSNADMFNSVVINDTTRACPEAVVRTLYEGYVKWTYVAGSIWHYYAIDQPGTPMTFGPFINCPDADSCKPVYPVKPAPPEPTRWATCSHMHNIFWQQQYEICGGGPWPEGTLGKDGELANKISGCGLGPTRKTWRTYSSPRDPGEWCFSLNHMMGAKNCIGNVLDWDYHVNKSTCWGPG